MLHYRLDAFHPSQSVALRSQQGGPGGQRLPTPAGVDPTAVLLTMGEGYDAELQSSFLDRILFSLAHPPAGGTQYDYVSWARSVAGVTAAIPYPLRRGLGTMDICILTNGLPASPALIQTVSAYINTVSPAGGDFRVVTPTLVPVPIVGTIALAAGTTLASVLPIADSSLSDYFASLVSGVTVNRGRLLAAITDISGVTDLNLLQPVASVPMLVDENNIQLASLGPVTLTPE